MPPRAPPSPRSLSPPPSHEVFAQAFWAHTSGPHPAKRLRRAASNPRGVGAQKSPPAPLQDVTYPAPPTRLSRLACAAGALHTADCIPSAARASADASRPSFGSQVRVSVAPPRVGFESNKGPYPPYFCLQGVFLLFSARVVVYRKAGVLLGFCLPYYWVRCKREWDTDCNDILAPFICASFLVGTVATQC